MTTAAVRMAEQTPTQFIGEQLKNCIFAYGLTRAAPYLENYLKGGFWQQKSFLNWRETAFMLTLFVLKNAWHSQLCGSLAESTIYFLEKKVSDKCLGPHYEKAVEITKYALPLLASFAAQYFLFFRHNLNTLDPSQKCFQALLLLQGCANQISFISDFRQALFSSAHEKACAQDGAWKEECERERQFWVDYGIEE